MKIAWYTSGHGFGHISRSSVIIQELLKNPLLNEITLVSPRVNFLNDHPKLIKRNVKTDTGVYQKSSIEIDINKTLRELEEFQGLKPELTGQETKFLQEWKPDLVISDVSSFPVFLAGKMGIPAIIISNFTWDFIYNYYGKYDKRFSEFAAEISSEYEYAAKKIILPFNCDFPESPNNIKTGVIGRKPSMDREGLRKKFRFSDNTRYILISFGAYGLGELNLKLENLPADVMLVSADTKPVQNGTLQIDNEYYPDILRACDFVLTKPGYGIMSECFFSKTPVIYTGRGDFPEYQYLVNSLQKHFVSFYITKEELENLDLKNALYAKPDWPTETLSDGLEQVVNQIISFSG